MKKPFLIIGGIVLLVLLLTGAAFVGGRLLNGQGLSGLSFGRPGMVPGGVDAQSVKINADNDQPAKVLPQTAADVRGVFDHRQDNSIFVGTGRVTVAGRKDDPKGNTQTSASHDGPNVEVVVTSQTSVYEDVTMRQFDGPPPEGQKIQQVVQPGTLDEIGQNSMIMVWGRKTGDRFIADVLVYNAPNFIMK